MPEGTSHGGAYNWVFNFGSHQTQGVGVHSFEPKLVEGILLPFSNGTQGGGRGPTLSGSLLMCNGTQGGGREPPFPPLMCNGTQGGGRGPALSSPPLMSFQIQSIKHNDF